jgi:hypothetical protein
VRETEIYSVWLERATGLPAALTAFGFIAQTAPAYDDSDAQQPEVQPRIGCSEPDRPSHPDDHTWRRTMDQHNSPRNINYPRIKSDDAMPQLSPPGGNGMAVAGLVLGITSIVFCWCGLLSLAQIILAIVFSSTGIRQANRGADRKVMAIAGLATAITGALAYLTIGIASMGTGFLI